MTLTDIQSRLDQIRTIARTGDNGSAHVFEDALYRDFIAYLVHCSKETMPTPEAMMESFRLILCSDSIEFHRGCC